MKLGQQPKTKYDLTGKRFERLLVLERDGTRLDANGFSRGPTYKCLCDCGNTKDKILSRSLVDGKTRSCGCLLREYQLSSNNLSNLAKGRDRSKTGESSAFNRILDIYIRSANQRDIAWLLSIEEFKTLIRQACYYCGKPPSQLKVTTGSEMLWNGIDRVDPVGNYEMSNCVSCCNRCNTGKWTDTSEEFIQWIQSVYTEMSKKGVI